MKTTQTKIIIKTQSAGVPECNSTANNSQLEPGLINQGKK